MFLWKSLSQAGGVSGILYMSKDTLFLNPVLLKCIPALNPTEAWLKSCLLMFRGGFLFADGRFSCTAMVTLPEVVP